MDGHLEVGGCFVFKVMVVSMGMALVIWLYIFWRKGSFIRACVTIC